MNEPEGTTQEKFAVEEHFFLPYSANTPVGKYVWTHGSRDNLPLFKALQWANTEGAPLQELAGAMLFNAGLQESREISDDGSALVQIVNTVCVAHRSKNGWVMNYCRLPNSDDGVKLAEQGYQINKNGSGQWGQYRLFINDDKCEDFIVSLDDKVLRAMIDEAQQRERVVPALNTNILQLHLLERNWPSSPHYASHPHIIAALGGIANGREIAAITAEYLQKRSRDHFFFLDALGTQILEWDLPECDPRAQTHAVVRCVSFDDAGFSSCGHIYADSLFTNGGRARGGCRAYEMSRIRYDARTPRETR